jgi:hypothetical protein
MILLRRLLIGATACILMAGVAFGQYPGPTSPTTAAPVFLVDPVSGGARGGSSRLNITAATNVKTTPGRVYRVIVNNTSAASGVSTIIDSTGTSVTAAATILVIPAAAAAGTTYLIDWPCAVGISVVPGSGAIISIAYD